MVEVIVGVRGQVNSRGYKPSGYDDVFTRMKYQLSESMENAVEEAIELLSDGQWYKTSLVYAIAKKHGVRRGNLMYQLPVAVSDSMKYFCIPNDDTPLEAPKNFRQLSEA